MGRLPVGLLLLAGCAAPETADERVRLRAEVAGLRRELAALPKSRVLAVRTGAFGTLVSISLGSAGGLRRGVVRLVRGGELVGMLRIDRVERNQSVGLLDQPGPAAPPRAGDIAYPR